MLNEGMAQKHGSVELSHNGGKAFSVLAQELLAK